MAEKDFYKVLGVSRKATAEEIRKAFKKIARENHPDVKPGDDAAVERFKQAAEAYDVLGDEEKRKQYDQFGANYKHFQGGHAGPGPEPFRRGGPVDVDLRDLFGGGGAVDLEDLFSGFFGGARSGGARAPRAQRGEDLTSSIEIPFQLAALGGNYDLSLQKDGRTERLSVKIPAGIDHGQTIRLSGQGQPGRNNGPPGDLRVTVLIAPHPYFRREGLNLFVEVPVTITEAALGARIDVPTLEGEMVTMTLPPGTSSGAKLRLKGKGIEKPRGHARGDQFVTIRIVVPKSLDERSRELLEEFAQLNPQAVRESLWPK